MMDPEGPFARAERTLWTVWCFISEAVNRLLRPQPAPGVGTEQNPCLEPAGEGEPPECEDAEDALAAVALLNLPHTADSQPDGDTVQQKTPPSQRGEEAGRDDAEPLSAEDAGEPEKEETRPRPPLSYQETSENDKHEQHVDIGSKPQTDGVISEKIKKSEEETVCSVCDVTTDDQQETKTIVQLKDEDDDETPERELEAADSGGDQRTITDLEPEKNDSVFTDDTEQKCEGEDEVSTQEEAGSRINVVEVDQKMEADEETARVDNGDFTDVADVEKHEDVIGTRSENTLEEVDRWSLDKREQRDLPEEDDVNDGANNWGYTQTLRGDEEETVSSEHVACSDSPVEGEHLYPAEFTEKEPEDLASSQEQTDTRRADMKLGDVAADLRCIPESQAEERFSVNEDGKDSFVEIAETSSTAAVKPEGETGRETSGELSSIPPGTVEGRVVVLEEPNAPACEETQEGLPENNNELGRDENTTPRFLEVDYKEFQAVQLPEEAESHGQESPQDTEAACLQMSESVEERQERAEDTKTVVGLAEVEQIGILPLLAKETERQFSEEAIQDFDRPLKSEISESPMKTEARNLRMIDGTEMNLLGFGADETLSGSRDVQSVHEVKQDAPAEEVTEFTAAFKGEEMTQTGLSQEFFHTAPYSSSQAHSAGSLDEERNDPAVNELDTDDNVEDMDEGVQQLAPVAGELITPSEGEENAAVKQSVLSTPDETGEIKQFPLTAFEIGTEEISNNETTDDLTVMQSEAGGLSDVSAGESTEHVTESLRWFTEGSASSITAHQDLIDEEILDLWMETAMSFSNQPNSQDTSVEVMTPGTHLLNEASETGTGSHPGSGIISTVTHQESEEEEMQKESLESAEAGKQTEEADVMMSVLSPDELLEATAHDSSEEVTRSSSEASSEEGSVWIKHSSEGDVSPKYELEEMNTLSMEEQPSGHTAESSNTPEGDREPVAMLEDQTELFLSIQVDAPVLDFTPQRSRISLKNPRVRPPNNPRYLLNMPSLEPTSTSPVPVKLPAGVPLGALGTAIKLPGLAAGFPLLKKTPRKVKDEDSQEPLSQEAETMPEEKSDASKEEEAPHKPKWMPPKHPGFGNPLMSELKTKLKKTSNE
ncbi:uncharacterized protein LOC115393572 isoform X2 [Salarias fasciatus]|uniref:uncharacterized protein LOC115393572 isoform X2 n=1 Tax=Salarias fasciatus TaxID=181472 RepID=UPI001176EB74|nr:uncharacterized protein LOC115393572 isoform X2 [Salarias fasciatus]